MADAWDLHDCGFVPANQFPVFMRRATAMEELLDMEERLRRARTAVDIDLIQRLR